MSSAEKLLSRLQGVRRCGAGRWMARCPAHADKSPSLSIRETEDHTLLLHCFANCDTGAILAALDLQLRDLFPVPLAHRAAPLHRGAHAHAAQAALRSLRHDALVLAVAASQVAAGTPLDQHDLQTLFAVAARARRIAELCVYDT